MTVKNFVENSGHLFGHKKTPQIQEPKCKSSEATCVVFDNA